MSYDVCWTCRGLFVPDKNVNSAFKHHISSCNKGANSNDFIALFDHYVCDKLDFMTIMDLKKTIIQYEPKAINKHSVPEKIVKVLLALQSALIKPSKTQLAPSKNDGTLTENDRSKLNRTFCRGGGSLLKDKQSVLKKNMDNSNAGLLITIKEPNVKQVSGKTESTNLMNNTKGCRSETITSANNTVIKDSSITVSVDKTNLELLTEEEKFKLETECVTLKINKTLEYVCKVCQYKSKSAKISLRHLKTHNNQTFTCPHCQFSCSKRSKWTHHLRIHTEGKIKCQFCPDRFTTSTKLKKHIESEHPEMTEKARLQCDECNYIGRNEIALKEHKRKHSGETLRCTHKGCNFSSLYQRSLQQHLLQKHSAEKSQVCDVCGFQTRHASSLKKHMMLHRDFKPYKCAMCSFTGINPAAVIHHVKLKHFKLKRYSCPYCPFKTGYSLTIKKHVERHEGLKRYACPVCGEEMESVRKAKQHVKKSHGGSDYKILTVPKCSKIKPNAYAIENSHYRDAFNVIMMKESDIEKDLKKPMAVNTETNANDLLELTSHVLETEGTATESSENVTPTASVIPLSFFDDNTKATPSKERNPMLSATTDDLDDSLIEDSLFDLMTDFPRLPILNRCQSASTLMFTSISPHLVDRPLTPDFFSDTSGSSFFHNIGPRNMDADPLPLGTFSNFGSLPNPSFPNTGGFSRSANPASPLLPTFTNSPPAVTSDVITGVNFTNSDLQAGSSALDVDQQLLTDQVLLELQE